MSLSGRKVYIEKKNKDTIIPKTQQIPNLDKLENKIAKVEKDILDQKSIDIDKKINEKIILLENKINNKDNIIKTLENKINELQSQPKQETKDYTEDIEELKNQISKQEKIIQKLLFDSIN